MFEKTRTTELGTEMFQLAKGIELTLINFLRIIKRGAKFFARVINKAVMWIIVPPVLKRKIGPGQEEIVELGKHNHFTSFHHPPNTLL